MNFIIKITDTDCTAYPILNKLVVDGMSLILSNGTLYQSKKEKENIIKEFSWFHSPKGEWLYYLAGDTRQIERSSHITIGSEDMDIAIKGFPYDLLLEGSTLYMKLKDMTQGFQGILYRNGSRISGEECQVEDGDDFFIEGFLITVHRAYLSIRGDFSKTMVKSLEVQHLDQPYNGFPEYKRSPRIIKRTKDTKIDILPPPQKRKMRKGEILQSILPSVVMMVLMVVVSMMGTGGAYILITVCGTFMTVIFSIVRIVDERKECKEGNAKRLLKYGEYLLRKRKEVYGSYVKEMEAYQYNYPSLPEISRMIHNYSERIYERSRNDEDFLTFSLGTISDFSMTTVHTNEDELQMENDELVNEASNIRNEFSMVHDKPVVIDLKKAHLGIAGEKKNVHAMLKSIVAQLTFFQSYHDLEFVVIYNEKYDEDFKWMRWYKHFRIHAININSLVNSEEKRDQIMGSLQQMIKDRKLKLEEDKDKQGRIFLPHLVFIIDEPQLIMDHAIMEYLDKEGYPLGLGIIYTSYSRASLPENIGSVVIVENSTQATLLINERIHVDQEFTIPSAEGIDYEWMARDLGVLDHVQGVMSKIPNSITFFDMYEVKRPEELQIRKRWENNVSYKTLAVPLGVRAEKDYVYLNLHEKAHGPHGLVAGTTGSGKSETVQSYILSLAVNFHPYEVGFLLIDYKGGGMASLFRNLPHLLGTITNLDGSESMRAMASIKSELARRQRIFNEYNVNHINAYNKLFRNGTAKEPMPHLFLISDEFAELKKEQPDFMKELVSAARIGRSLGVHLILATQKPSGVVDDQIWTNSKFKLALKVQDEADSREMLKTPDAASITQAGRAYLQVGNNEIYELFQSAWSGAAFSEEEAEVEKVDDRVFLINDLGQGELVNEDLSKSDDSNKLKETQLDVTVNYIHDLYQSMNCIEVPRPWLPSLQKEMISPVVSKEYMKKGLCVPVGMVDIPEAQAQEECVLDFIKDGNVMFVASSGFGKTVFLTTVALSLAMMNTVKELNFYILDFGNSALIPLKKLPHVADYMTFEDAEKMGKFFELIEKEMRDRKKEFAKLMAQNFEVYNQMSEEKLPAIVILVDNYDLIKEMEFEQQDFFARVSRDGAGLGIFIVIAANQSGSIRYNTFNNYKIKICGFSFDDGEVMSVVGRTEYKVPEVKGRALVKHKELISIMQIYTMASCTDEIAYNKSIVDLTNQVASLYPNEHAKHIPVLPETLDYVNLADYDHASDVIMLGLDKKSVDAVGFTRDLSPFAIVGESGKGKTNAIKIILDQIKGTGPIYLFDSKDSELFSYKLEKSITYMEGDEMLEEFISAVTSAIEERNGQIKAKMEEHPELNPKMIRKTLSPFYIVSDDWDTLVEYTEDKEDEMASLLTNAVSAGISIIMTCHSSKLNGYDDVTKFASTSTDGVLLSDPGRVSMFDVNSSRELPEFKDGLLFHNGTYIRIRIPKY